MLIQNRLGRLDRNCDVAALLFDDQSRLHHFLQRIVDFEIQVETQPANEIHLDVQVEFFGGSTAFAGVPRLVPWPSTSAIGVPSVRALDSPACDQLGGYLLGTGDSDLLDSIQFHLEAIGCPYCLANLDDLKKLHDA